MKVTFLSPIACVFDCYIYICAQVKMQIDMMGLKEKTRTVIMQSTSSVIENLSHLFSIL